MYLETLSEQTSTHPPRPRGRSTSSRSLSGVLFGTCGRRPPISCHLPPRLPHLTMYSSCQLYTYVAFRLRQPWCPRRGPQGRGSTALPTGHPPVQGAPSPRPARGSGRTRMCSDGTAGGRKPHRQGGQAGSKRARFGFPNLCRKNREALADRFLWMAPLRLTGRSVAA